MPGNDPLAALKDIHLPNPISWWPLGPLWYVLIGLSLIIGGFLCWFAYKKHTENYFKKKALLLLEDYQKEFECNKDAQSACVHISELLRRVAMIYYPRKQVAGLHQEQWIHFLNQTAKGVDFTVVQHLLLEAPFKPTVLEEVEPLISRARLWIEQRGKPCST